MKRISFEKIETIAQKMRSLPPVEPSKRDASQSEAIRILKKEIISLQKRGYTIEQIAEFMRGEGADIATPTLKSYLQRAKTQKSRKRQNNDEPAGKTANVSTNAGATDSDTPPPPPPPRPDGRGRFTVKEDTADI